jgi:hypothetical protein
VADPIGTSFQSITYSSGQQYVYEPGNAADYAYRVSDLPDGGKTYHMVHVPNDPSAAQYQYTVLVTDAATNTVSITESFSGGSNTYNGQIVSHNAGAFVVDAHSGNTPIEWLFSSAASDDAYITVYPNGSAQSGTFMPTCFVTGTRLLTSRGEVAVEDLREGDLMVTDDGSLQLAIWIGYRKVQPALWKPEEATPIRIRAHAFGENKPRCDLLVSPGHAVPWEGALIPIWQLVNAVTIRRDCDDPITYYHVELPKHAMLVAEGMPMESFLDFGNRSAFANGGILTQLHARLDSPVAVPGEYGPRLSGGDQVDAARRMLIERALQQGFDQTRDPAASLTLDGREIAPSQTSEIALMFDIPPGQWKDVRLRSRAAAPAWTIGNGDFRVLGIAIEGFEVSDGETKATVSIDKAGLTVGVHEPESDDEGNWRWTDGDAHLPLSLCAAFPNGGKLTVRLRHTMQYWVTDVEASCAVNPVMPLAGTDVSRFQDHEVASDGSQASTPWGGWIARRFRRRA